MSTTTETAEPRTGPTPAEPSGTATRPAFSLIVPCYNEEEVIGYTVRRLVLRRLIHFEGAARALAKGDLDRRVQVEGDDALTRVEEQFNTMADSVVGLLTEVRQQRASLERVMNSVDDGMVVLDRDRTVVAVNDAFNRRFPSDAPNLIGRHCCSNSSGKLGCCNDGTCPTLRCFTKGEVQRSRRVRLFPIYHLM